MCCFIVLAEPLFTVDVFTEACVPRQCLGAARLMVAPGEEDEGGANGGGGWGWCPWSGCGRLGLLFGWSKKRERKHRGGGRWAEPSFHAPFNSQLNVKRQEWEIRDEI